MEPSVPTDNLAMLRKKPIYSGINLSLLRPRSHRYLLSARGRRTARASRGTAELRREYFRVIRSCWWSLERMPSGEPPRDG